MNNIPRNEYPRPQMRRSSWQNLNGEWEFEFDFGKSGKERGVLSKDKLDRTIIVPFCPESVLSGIGYTDFINAVWYRRTFTVPQDWLKQRTILHFEAVDYSCEIWVNGVSVATHRGGYTPISIDITAHITGGDNTVALYAEDDTRTGLQPCGKQSKVYASAGCDYTRVTGIWQTVWLENVPNTYIKSYKLTPDVDNSCVHITITPCGDIAGGSIAASAAYKGKVVGTASAQFSGEVMLTLDVDELHLWQPLAPEIYDLTLTLTADNASADTVDAYFGMRSIQTTDNCVLINGKPVFQRLVLDQGYYPDGIYTASSDDALKRDIELSMEMGFNGARMHQKVFERRYLYHADMMGYMVWGEYGNWGLNHAIPEALEIFLPEWLESVARDCNSPALVGWCPFNETWDYKGHVQDDAVIRGIYLATKAADTTRPVVDTSGGYHVNTDIFDIHDYCQDPAEFAAKLEPMKNGGEVYNPFPEQQHYANQPYAVSEYGGIRWCPNSPDGWGYGQGPADVDEFIYRYCGLADAILQNPRIFALCYTQLYDVEQEVNGLYYYDRTRKFDDATTAKLRAAMMQKAAIEE